MQLPTAMIGSDWLFCRRLLANLVTGGGGSFLPVWSQSRISLTPHTVCATLFCQVIGCGKCCQAPTCTLSNMLAKVSQQQAAQQHSSASRTYTFLSAAPRRVFVLPALEDC